MQENNKKRARKPGLGQIVLSTLAGAIGVQSNKNREKDFQSGSMMHFVVAGIVFTILFVLTLILIVKTVLGNMG
ncbi:DUF2970 domain-containing protein [Microbulbifer variabilis]|jgi:hypothetical protein|uniref:DUF2970 domain-containing protein n=1 Tax=Microbulbifer variabilis TaxID=266805 RepID=A0ABY4VGD3_9GAMM|nr:DUF2970 domain-containing protein [Microbulbifer variabilis]USD23249.1 DUF2970 domain-containing protein [Microbulbifer variabilis]